MIRKSEVPAVTPAVASDSPETIGPADAGEATVCVAYVDDAGREAAADVPAAVPLPDTGARGGT